MSMLFNPATISIVLLTVLCVKRVNVLLSIIISAIVAGILSGLNVKDVMDIFISGMGSNSETALSYILLGTFAATMSHCGVANAFASKITKIIHDNKYILLSLLILISMASQNVIPIHIAFIPIIIPPLLPLFNKFKIDRRAVACVLSFGLKMPYITLPVGFGLIFQNLIADNMVQNGAFISRNEVWKYTFILGIAMLVGLLFALFISYRSQRIYNEIPCNQNKFQNENYGNKYTLTCVILAAVTTFVVQIITRSLPLGALVGLGIIFTTKVISKDNMDNLMNEGVYMMGYIAFVMLVAAGFAAVLKETGSIDVLVASVLSFLPNDVMLISLIMLILGLFITIGIGTSFGTIPILAVLFIPICLKTGFSNGQIALLLAASAALGDAGSPASDTTLGPTSGLNADGQHNHIYDTCIPTFLHYNIPLIIFALLGIYLMSCL